MSSSNLDETCYLMEVQAGLLTSRCGAKDSDHGHPLYWSSSLQLREAGVDARDRGGHVVVDGHQPKVERLIHCRSGFDMSKKLRFD